MEDVLEDMSPDYESNDFSSASYWDNSTVKITRILIHEVILLTGIFGSIMTCLIVFRRRRMQTPVYTFIGTLAVIDLLYGLGSVIISPTYTLFETWILGTTFCYVASFVDVFHNFCSIIIIATSTFLILCHEINLKMAFITNFIIALGSAILSLPTTVHTELYTTHSGHQYCISNFESSDFLKKAEHFLQLILNTVVPVAVLLTSCVVRRGNASSMRLLLAILIIYVLLVSPMILLTFFFDLPFGYLVVLSLLAQLKIVYKTIVCYVMDATFKEEFLGLITCCFRKTKRNAEIKMQQHTLIH